MEMKRTVPYEGKNYTVRAVTCGGFAAPEQIRVLVSDDRGLYFGGRLGPENHQKDILEWVKEKLARLSKPA